MKNKILLGIIALLTLTIILLVGFKWHNGRKQEDIIKDVAPPATQPSLPVDDMKEDYVSPVDFASLEAQNPDIYAWIRINNTCVDYPIVQRTGDNNYYHRRNFLGESEWNGCIYTED